MTLELGTLQQKEDPTPEDVLRMHMLDKTLKERAEGKSSNAKTESKRSSEDSNKRKRRRKSSSKKKALGLAESLREMDPINMGIDILPDTENLIDVLTEIDNFLEEQDLADEPNHFDAEDLQLVQAAKDRLTDEGFILDQASQSEDLFKTEYDESMENVEVTKVIDDEDLEDGERLYQEL